MTESGDAYRHSIRVRYGECDMQGIVFNAHYLAYFDDAFDHYLRLHGWSEVQGWEIMLKRCEIVWQGGLQVEETVDIDLSLARWGTTSFDIRFLGSVAGEERVECTTTYVVVDGVEHAPKPIPAELRSMFG